MRKREDEMSPHNIVFIVEDNELYSTMLDYMLSNDFICRFVSFKSGEECLQNLHMRPFMVILDYALPGIDGIRTLEEIKKYNREIEVVILTGRKDKTVLKNAFKAGAYDYVVKGKKAIQHITRITNTVLSDRARKSREKDEQSNSLLYRIVSVTVAITALVVGTLYFME